METSALGNHQHYTLSPEFLSWRIAVLASPQGDQDTCRAEVVCSRCSDGCDDDILEGVTFSSNSTVPAADCKVLPVGTDASGAGTTLATLNLAKGYYRTSNESHIVLMCYQKDACTGGIDADNYCAAGYRGPCKCNAEK